MILIIIFGILKDNDNDNDNRNIRCSAIVFFPYYSHSRCQFSDNSSRDKILNQLETAITLKQEDLSCGLV
jgi:hypothetical protein